MEVCISTSTTGQNPLGPQYHAHRAVVALLPTVCVPHLASLLWHLIGFHGAHDLLALHLKFKEHGLTSPQFFFSPLCLTYSTLSLHQIGGISFGGPYPRGNSLFLWFHYCFWYCGTGRPQAMLAWGTPGPPYATLIVFKVGMVEIASWDQQRSVTAYYGIREVFSYCAIHKMLQLSSGGRALGLRPLAPEANMWPSLHWTSGLSVNPESCPM